MGSVRLYLFGHTSTSCQQRFSPLFLHPTSPFYLVTYDLENNRQGGFNRSPSSLLLLSSFSNIMTGGHGRTSKFYCSYCGENCGTKWDLTQHISIYHYERPPIPEDLHCTVCEKTFPNAFAYNGHKLACFSASEFPAQTTCAQTDPPNGHHQRNNQVRAHKNSQWKEDSAPYSSAQGANGHCKNSTGLTHSDDDTSSNTDSMGRSHQRIQAVMASPELGLAGALHDLNIAEPSTNSIKRDEGQRLTNKVLSKPKKAPAGQPPSAQHAGLPAHDEALSQSFVTARSSKPKLATNFGGGSNKVGFKLTPKILNSTSKRNGKASKVAAGSQEAQETIATSRKRPLTIPESYKQHALPIVERELKKVGMELTDSKIADGLIKMWNNEAEEDKDLWRFSYRKKTVRYNTQIEGYRAKAGAPVSPGGSVAPIAPIAPIAPKGPIALPRTHAALIAFAAPGVQSAQPAHATPATQVMSQQPLPRLIISDDAKQTKGICLQMLRLKLQADVVVDPDGFIAYQGLNWPRISAEKQADVVKMLDSRCSLPDFLQAKHYMPKLRSDDPDIPYDQQEFSFSPALTPGENFSRVIALSCAKVMLSGGTEEVVKIAAIDVLSCNILLNHLVCPDSQFTVKNWRTSITGLRGFADFELARIAGYQVFKGWKAARTALWDFVDNTTILVGHNLRGDLDALRMIHGRGVDVGVMTKRAAGDGPTPPEFSKAQLSLDNLCREMCGTLLEQTTHPVYGRDAAMNALAIRQLALSFLKNPAELQKKAKRMSLDYMRAMGRF
ncbi:hypothetical protein GQ43DRAFT_9730 [Delitschia confertaspora ATCC 74209]|uniref:C2H2-type domain-containing protein n=1 Tax=Delitschia confertaspora ATCC 74209 TaxID=1513339 RepID=A0A9P4MT28_9PLEO|nr:hypothetical protein GQ43DRAFT_9730 [Delitschia confertaspora ATCC 74209]